MKTASILLALVVVLGFATEAGARLTVVTTNLSFEIGQHRYGFIDRDGMMGNWTTMYAGTIGDWNVPFTATQGLVGFSCILATLIIVPVVFTVRWKKQRATA